MNVYRNGWLSNNFHHINLIYGNWFGLKVDKWYNGNLQGIGMFINTKRFGWVEIYNEDGDMDNEYCGFYLNNKKL